MEKNYLLIFYLRLHLGVREKSLLGTLVRVQQEKEPNNGTAGDTGSAQHSAHFGSLARWVGRFRLGSFPQFL